MLRQGVLSNLQGRWHPCWRSWRQHFRLAWLSSTLPVYAASVASTSQHLYPSTCAQAVANQPITKSLQIRAAITTDGGLHVRVTGPVDSGPEALDADQQQWVLALTIEKGADYDWAKLVNTPLVGGLQQLS